MLLEEKIQVLIELHTEIQRFLNLYTWGEEHGLETETMQSLKPCVSTLNAVHPVLEKEIRDNDYLPREPDKDASDIEQLLILLKKEVFDDAGSLHSDHLLASRQKIQDLKNQCSQHEYSTPANEAISRC